MLIILSKSPFVGDYASIFDMALRAVQKGEKVGVLHIHDSCVALTSDEYSKKLVDAGLNVYALKADCEARGLLKKIKKGVKIVDYKDWVKLVMDEYDRIVSWT
ncbi:MAG: sulfurtransferase complex subunit TusB [Candidatus Bathyarchaeota archaeon]|nr:sulfurtransferase complex subunit TusB [Candidatus Bathyarchaeota archaeon]